MKLLLKLIFAFFCLFSGLHSFGQLTSTNLPIVIITTPAAITTTQSQGSVSIIDNISGTNTPSDPAKFVGMIGINIRGNATSPKPSYSIETWSAPTISLDTSLLGMPSENDWVLLSSYEDRSLMRSTLAFKTHDQMGRYSPRMKYCEVIVNSQYQGIYTFGEKIKRDSLRLDIAKLTNIDNAGENLTGGYIWRIDGNGAGWTSAFLPPFASTQTINFEYDYPSATDIIPAQEAYIKSYIDSFEAAMNASNFQDTALGWRRFGAVNSFIDFMIMQEVSKNNEAYRKNTFFFKDKSTKMRPGPLWNFELAWKNTSDCNSAVDTGWCYNYGGVCGTSSKLPTFWWNKLSTDAQFMEDLKCRYSQFRKPGGALDTATLFHAMDSINNYLNLTGAVNRNFTQYPIWGVPLVNEPLPMAATYVEEIDNMKKFIKTRLAWLDTKWITTSPLCPSPVSVKNISKKTTLSLYPNPSSKTIQVVLQQTQANEFFKAELFNIQGSKVITQTGKGDRFIMNIQSLPQGIYVLHVRTKQGMSSTKLIKE
ncbi:MAG: CotH kinase family protein [Chitinophagaceae bacterium]|nr:CotH kinase family protein [Chitinophagaceae bacterium]